MVYLYYNIFGFNKRTRAFIINFSIKIYYLPQQHPCYLFIYIILNFPINLFFTVWITSIIILPWDVPSFDSSSSCCLYSFMPYVQSHGNYSAPGHYVVVSRRRSAARRHDRALSFLRAPFPKRYAPDCGPEYAGHCIIIVFLPLSSHPHTLRPPSAYPVVTK